MAPFVLVADADPELADLIGSYLDAIGYSVDCVTTGPECLEHLRRRSPDVLVYSQDLSWGGGDGVLSVLHDDGDSAIPAVVLTTGEDSVAPQATSLVTPLQKPFRLAELAKCIAALSTSRVHSARSDLSLRHDFRGDHVPAS